MILPNNYDPLIYFDRMVIITYYLIIGEIYIYFIFYFVK
jgi:hypothetical protein